MAYPYGFLPGFGPLQGMAPGGGSPLTSGGGLGALGFPQAQAGGGGGGLQPGQPIDPSTFLAFSSPGFTGLQGFQPGIDPSSLDFNQLSMLMGLTSGAPQRIDQFQGQTRQQINRLGQAGQRAIGQQAASQFASGANQLGAAQRQGQSQQADAFAAMGLAPSIFAGMVPQQNMELAAQLGALRGQTFGAIPGQQQQLREEQFDRRTGLNQAALSARNQIEQYYDSLLLQKYLAEIAAQAQMSAAGKAADSQRFGDILGLGGAILGGPLGGAIGNFLGGLF